LTEGANYLPIEEILLTLPDQVKDEFKKAFSNFVTDEWQQIKKQLEVFTGSGIAWNWKIAYDSAVTNNGTTTALMTSGYANFDNYIIFSPIVGDDNFKYNYFLELKDGTQAVKQIMDLYVKESFIANTTYRIWGKNGEVDGVDARSGIFVKQTDLKTYLDKIVTKLSPFKDSFSTVAIKKQQEVTLFGTSDENIIKLMLYKTCKNIYDKWIGGASDGDNVIFQCGGRNSVDTDLAKKRGSNSAKLIDSFRFITRSFKDIGDELAINPIPVATYLRDNPNSSVYDALGGLLSSNNFTFVPLPAFINYRDPKILESMFEAIPYYQAQTLTDDLCGPSFVCTYVGQTSKHLDYNDSNYTNDGFDVRCDGGTVIGLPKDYNTKAEDYEDVVTFFNVKFGQQNQNIFKDIALDQSEFSETAESLQIIDDISKKGAETNRSLAGQNIYNVYSVRSYKAEVEMLGNAMIQPMMQFQLDNIPMFHGAYMITRVKHSLKPNSMTTHFTGSRLRQATTKIFSSGDLYMSLLDSMDNANTATGGGGTFTKSFPPIVATIIDDSGQNGVIKDSKIGTLPVKQIKVPKGILLNMKKDDNPILLSEAVDSLEKMLGDWLDWMTTSGFKGNAGNYAYINSAFRTYEVQERLKKEKGDNAATPGTSRHGWGIAIDFQFFRKNGEIIHNYVNKIPNVVEGYDFSINESIVWLLENSYTYGWIIPEELRDDTGTEEFWHFEYHGRSAKCILEKKPKIKGKDIITTLDYKDIVKNPVDKDGKEAVYDTCDFVTRKSIDGTFEIISPENVGIVITPPSSDDIAFYNAILTGINAPLTPENLKFFYAWRKAESGEAAWNPFNTTQKSDNTTNYNCNAGFPVKNYASKDLGIKATVETLTSVYYPKILEGLRKNVGAYKISTYVDELGTWGTGYGVNKVLAGANLVPPPISQTGKEASCPKLV
jgi:LAS superfamily LD-carboxypeptidase LdcB